MSSSESSSSSDNDESSSSDSNGSDHEQQQHDQEEHPADNDSSSSDDDGNEVPFTSDPPRKRLKTPFDIAEEDRISTLPEPVLLHILSFRDMRAVIRTSKISRRWRSLWKSVPSLRFHYSKQRRLGGYLKSSFVDLVLLHRNENANIDKLVFTYLNNPHFPDLQRWISAAERRHVQELHLNLKSKSGSGRRERELPSFIFNSALKVFKFHGGYRAPVSKSMCVASQLRTIKLHNAWLPHEKHNSRNKVTISCPVLEDLILSNCDHKTIKKLCVFAPQLKTLVLDNQDSSKEASNCKLTVSAPNLTSLVLRGIMYKNCMLKNLSSLVAAELELDKQPVEAQILNNVLQGVKNVKSLSLNFCLQTSPVSSTADYLFLIPFVNLRSLRLIGSSDGCDVRPVQLLRRSPLIEILVLNIRHVKNMDKDCADLLQCLHGLKYFEIQGIQCKDHELDFCKFVLENAPVLEDFTAISHEKLALKTKKEKAIFDTKLHSLYKASSAVDIYFS